MQKQTFVYPGSDLDRSRTLINALGTFWSITFTGKDQMHSYVNSVAYAVAQSHRNLLEVVAALSRYDVPLFHEKMLVPITIKKSELNTALTNADRFDISPITFDSGAKFDVATDKYLFSYPLPDKLVSVEQFFNKLTFPTAVLDNNVDFTIDRTRNALVFNSDPFDNPAFLRRAIPAGGALPDSEIVLWGFCGKYDYDYVFNQFAYAVGLKLSTSEGYKQLTNAIITGLINGGASVTSLDTAIAAICGVPLTVEPEETVEVIRWDNHGLFIATDKNIYRFAASSIPSVELEQVVPAGTQLIRCFDINEFFVGNTYIPAIPGDTQVLCRPVAGDTLSTNDFEGFITQDGDDSVLTSDGTACRAVRRKIDALAIDQGFLPACFYGDLTFENNKVPLEVITDHPSGYTYVRFPVGGIPADVDRFFDEIHARGIADIAADAVPCVPKNRRRGTLAHLLDKRVQPGTEPTAAHLPKTINPLQFIIENVLRNNVFVVRIVVSGLGQNHLGLYNVRHLRQLLPPQSAMIVVFELAPNTDKINAENNVYDALKLFTAAEPISDKIPFTLIREVGINVHSVSGTCQ